MTSSSTTDAIRQLVSVKSKLESETEQRNPQSRRLQSLRRLPIPNRSGMAGSSTPAAPQPSVLYHRPTPGGARIRRRRRPPPPPALTPTPPPASRADGGRPGSIRQHPRTARAAARSRPARRAWSTRTRTWAGPWPRTPSIWTGRTGSSAAAGGGGRRAGGGKGGPANTALAARIYIHIKHHTPDS